MIGVAISGIMVVVFSTIMSNMARETQSLRESLAALDLQKAATSALADGSVCKFLLPATSTFNATLNPTATSPIVIPIPGNVLYSSVTGTTPGPVLAQAGQSASPLTDSVRVTTMNLELTGKSGTSFTGNFVINFDNTRTVKPMRPVRVLASVTASGAVANATVASCLGAGGGGAGTGAGAGGNGQWCGAFRDGTVVMNCNGHAPTCTTLNALGNCMGWSNFCPSGYHLINLGTFMVSAGTPGSPGTSGQGTAGSAGSSGTLDTCTPN